MSDYPKTIKGHGIRGLSLIDQGPDHKGLRFKARAWDKNTRKHDTENFATEQEAKDWARNRLAKFELHLGKAGVFSISTMTDDFLEFLKAKGTKEKTRRTHKYILDSLVKAGINNLKDESVATKTQRLINNLRDNRHGWERKHKRTGEEPERQPASDNTKKNWKVMINTFGRWVRKHRKFHENPFEVLVTPRAKGFVKPIFSVEEARLMVSDAALQHEHGLYWAFSILTGMRQREAAWVRWSHIQWSAKRIAVRLEDDIDRAESELLTVSRQGARSRRIAKEVKRDKERDTIMPDELAEILAKVSEDGDGYVFPSRYRTYPQRSFKLALASLLKHVNLSLGKRTPHSTRHTNCCLLLAAGLGDNLVKLHMGHESVTTTEKYGTRALSMQEECRGWGQTIRLRSRVQTECKPSAKEPGKLEQAGANDDDGEMRPEDDLNDCQIVILPDHSSLFSLSQLAPAYSADTIQNPPPSGMRVQLPPRLPPDHNGTCDEEDDIGNPS